MNLATIPDRVLIPALVAWTVACFVLAHRLRDRSP